ncbi:hypothetical protein AGMMS49990_09790 [Endomicrobiia bacterium]|nr:hypothetical protein AGMMS49990_09790 [Endomicrobiia bacterium]
MRRRQIICTAIGKGKEHDFGLFKKACIYGRKTIRYMADTGFTGLDRIHTNTLVPKKRSKKHPLTKEDKELNREISSKRIIVENIKVFVKRFKIVSRIDK